MSHCRIMLASVFAACVSAAGAAELAFPIIADTYLDSQNAATNYGLASSVKVLVNSYDGSKCRGLLQLPDAVRDFAPDQIASARLCFYVFSDQTAGRSITLFPLTRAFLEGTGNGDGATWETHDGTNAWTSPGGDYDTNFPVAGGRVGDGYFQWDITALLTHGATRSNLLAYGALLRIEEEPLPASGTPRAPFTSSDNANPERPYLQLTVVAPLSFPITTDACLDSRSSNMDRNYGAASTIKVVVNNNGTGDGSVCRGLLRLPPEISLYAPDEILAPTIMLYVWQDNTTNRNITLYPLSRPFVEGDGNSTMPANGATWNTYDGTNPWTRAGGDYDGNFPVTGSKGDVLDPAMNDRFFSWDISALWTNETARNELLANGAMLQIDEVPTPETGMPRAPYTSSDDFSYSVAYRPQMRFKVNFRAPDAPRITADGNAFIFCLSNCTPYVTHRIERSTNLLQPGAWEPATNVVSSDGRVEWSEPINPEWTNVYYRVANNP